MDTVKEKKVVLQVMRGIAVGFVLLRHAIAKADAGIVLNNMEQVIICFHMTVVFGIAGYLYQKKLNKYLAEGKRHFIVNKIKHLLIPYAFWTIFLWGATNHLLFRPKNSKDDD